MNEFTTWIVNHWDEVLIILGAIYGVATLIAALTPTPKDDSFLSKLAEWANKFGITLKTRD